MYYFVNKKGGYVCVNENIKYISVSKVPVVLCAGIDDHYKYM